MNSRIQKVTPRYTKFENVLPDELNNIQIIEELEEAKNEINNIIEAIAAAQIIMIKAVLINSSGSNHHDQGSTAMTRTMSTNEN